VCCVSVDSLCQTAAAEIELAVRCLGAVVCVLCFSGQFVSDGGG